MHEINEFCEKNFNEIKDKINKANMVIIKNGGEREVAYKREVFDQLVYDRITFKGISHKAIVTLGALVAVLQIITLILSLFRWR